MKSVLIVALLSQAVVQHHRDGSIMVRGNARTITVDTITIECIDARGAAIERVREAWAPRSGGYSQWTTTRIWNPACHQACITITNSIVHEEESSECLRCMANAKDARDKAAKERAEREDRARAALDAVDAACGEPKP